MRTRRGCCYCSSSPSNNPSSPTSSPTSNSPSPSPSPSPSSAAAARPAAAANLCSRRPERAAKRARIALEQPPLSSSSSLSSQPSSSLSSSLLSPSSNTAASVDNRYHRNPFESLPDDLLLSIFTSISSTASSPSDLISPRLTCRKFNSIVTHPIVLASVSLKALTIKASHWSDGALRFLSLCAKAGNIEACYTLGMIQFYCLQEREQGILHLSRAAKASHPCALHSLAVIQFNGSGGTRKHKNLKAGVSFCMKAAALGHIDAMRELGHCLQDGYGIQRNILEGRRLLLEANAREAAAAITSNLKISSQTLQVTATKIAIGCFHHRFLYQPSFSKLNDAQKAALQQHVDFIHRHPIYRFLQSGGCSLLSDFGCNVPPPKLHISHQFMVDWYKEQPPEGGLRLCSHENCGRPETRRHEFRRCSACGSVNYCSRACQALDWKLRHKFVCVPAVNWQNRQDYNNHGNDNDNGHNNDNRIGNAGNNMNMGLRGGLDEAEDTVEDF